MFIKSAIQSHLIREMLEKLAEAERAASRRVYSASHLARVVAYELDEYSIIEQNESTINVLDDDGVDRKYKIKFIYTGCLGLVSYILTAVDPENLRVHLVFRGSKDAPAWCRATEAGAPGHMSFFADRDIILNELCFTLASLANNEKRVNLFISGHSLGGADAQNCATAIMIAMGQIDQHNQEYDSFKQLANILRITINLANPAGITALKATECKLHAKYLTQQMGVSLRIMFMITAGDAVPQSGESHILFDCSDEIAQIELVKLNTGYEGWLTKPYIAGALLTLPVSSVGVGLLGCVSLYSAYKAHKLKFLAHSELQQSYDLYSNATDLGCQVIKDKLGKHALNNPALDKLKSVLNALQTSFILTQRNFTREELEPHFVTEEDWNYDPLTFASMKVEEDNPADSTTNSESVSQNSNPDSETESIAESQSSTPKLTI
jgi:hypothetical protein